MFIANTFFVQYLCQRQLHKQSVNGSALEKMEISDNKQLENYGDQSKENDEYWEKEKQIKVHEFFVIG